MSAFLFSVGGALATLIAVELVRPADTGMHWGGERNVGSGGWVDEDRIGSGAGGAGGDGDGIGRGGGSPDGWSGGGGGGGGGVAHVRHVSFGSPRLANGNAARYISTMLNNVQTTPQSKQKQQPSSPSSSSSSSSQRRPTQSQQQEPSQPQNQSFGSPRLANGNAARYISTMLNNVQTTSQRQQIPSQSQSQNQKSQTSQPQSQRQVLQSEQQQLQLQSQQQEQPQSQSSPPPPRLPKEQLPTGVSAPVMRLTHYRDIVPHNPFTTLGRYITGIL